MGLSTIWALVAAALVIGELFTGEFTLLSLALGAAAAALAAAVGLGFIPQTGAALVLSVVSLFILAPWLRRFVAPRDTPDAIEAMVGTECEVVEAIEPPAQGKVKLDGVVWQAESDNPVPLGARVYIAEVLGARLRVMGRPDLLPQQPVAAPMTEAAERERQQRLAQAQAQAQEDSQRLS